MVAIDCPSIGVKFCELSCYALLHIWPQEMGGKVRMLSSPSFVTVES